MKKILYIEAIDTIKEVANHILSKAGLLGLIGKLLVPFGAALIAHKEIVRDV